MLLKNCDEWTPADGFTLEDVALEIVKSNNNNLVVAGPGAGKTELLAQRACYLLETNSCFKPLRILAISFKKDAATNLRDRVEKRCGSELAIRFDSMTYDAFAKSMLDRFVNGLQTEERPDKNYTIDAKEVNTNGKTVISFKDISRLAIKILETNPLIKKAIQLTYSHVFLDEFQDTTDIQYKLLTACFLDSTSCITAVGDSKQRIMLWAGAKKTVFEDFQKDFSASKKTMLMNHRSAPRLVEIQKSMYSSLNEHPADILHSSKWKDDQGLAYLRIFNNTECETRVICDEIMKLIRGGTKPREICLLAKQTINIYGEDIINYLASNEIKVRDEAQYQDLLKEVVVQILSFLVILITPKQHPIEWKETISFFYELEQLDDNTKPEVHTRMNNGISEMIETFKQSMNSVTDSNSFSEYIDALVARMSYEKIAASYPVYKDVNHFNSIIEGFKKLLWKEFEIVNDWSIAIHNFIGEDSIPFMTIHKSKGLEYENVFFIGLEDSAFWNFKRQPDEDKCAFFVALSRAKSRVDFTFCRGRQTRFHEHQSNEVINELYEMLLNTGLVEVIE